MGTNVSRGAAPTRAVLDAIRRIVQALRESSRAAEQRAGLSGAQLFVLHAVAESPGLSLNELAERTRTHQSSVSAVAARLTRARLIERSTAPGDARRAEIRLSTRGRQRLRSAPRTAQERLLAAIDALPAAERARLATVLDGLVRAMALGTKRPAMFFEDAARGRKRRAARG